MVDRRLNNWSQCFQPANLIVTIDIMTFELLFSVFRFSKAHTILHEKSENFRRPSSASGRVKIRLPLLCSVKLEVVPAAYCEFRLFPPPVQYPPTPENLGF